MDQNKKSKEYHVLKNRLFFVHLLLNIALLLIVLLSGLSLALRDFAHQHSGSFLALNGVYIVIFFLGLHIANFPLNVFEGFVWEHRFGLSNQKFLEWFWDDFKKALISSIITLLAVEAIYIFLRNFPKTWWIGATIFWLFVNLVLARLAPRFIIPIFFKYSDIEDRQLKKRILKLFNKCRIKIADAYSINFSVKTKKVNAFLCGLGNNRLVVLSDNLLSKFTADEIESVVAHEIAHYKHRDILKITAVSSSVTLLSFFIMDYFLKKALPWFGLTEIDDIAFFPMMALTFLIMGVLVMPFLNAYSRHLETKADAFSLKMTGESKHLISAFEKLGTMNLAEFEPSRLIEFMFYDHPPLSKRIKFAEGFQFSKGT